MLADDTLTMLTTVSGGGNDSFMGQVNSSSSWWTKERLSLFTDNCTNGEAYQEYLELTGVQSRQMNISTEYPLKYAQPLYGYCMPVLFIITIVANTLIVIVLAKRHMRSPTNTVLMAMALSDMFTILFPAPWLLYMYTFGNHYKPFYPTSACYAWVYMNEVLPNLFHTASIWLTLALAIQRYIYVCHAPVARTFCTMSRVFKAICLIYGIACIHQSTRFIDLTIEPGVVCWEGEVHHVCKKDLADWVMNVITPDVYFNIYFWFRVIFIHLLPCIALIVLNLSLFGALRQAQIKRDQLFKDNKRGNECRKLRDSQCTTLMLMVVVTVFLLVEVPLAVLTILHIVSSSVVEFLDYDIVNVLILFSNFSISASYPVNFLLYCGMSRQFRETFKDLFIPTSADPDGRNGSSRYSLVNGPHGGGPRTTCTNETAL